MEKEGYVRILNRLLFENLKVGTISTDRHVQIRKLMKTNENFKTIKHVIDPWHVIKGLAKKLLVKSKKKGCEKLGT